jgi:hypothetical protein
MGLDGATRPDMTPTVEALSKIDINPHERIDQWRTGGEHTSKGRVAHHPATMPSPVCTLYPKTMSS